MAMMKLACAVLMCMMVAAPFAEAAISCGTVASKVAPCIAYITGKGPGPSAGCCGGIKALNAAASTPADRKTACNCLKSAAGSIKGLNYGMAASLPSKCGVSIPYAISPNTNCNAVH
ncbi:unnamed protein product [Amaranthus hypochondriacus]